MKKLYALCLVTLLAVFVDLAFLHSKSVNAQGGTVRVRRVLVSAISGDVSVTGTVVGFTCFNTGGGDAHCFIADRQ